MTFAAFDPWLVFSRTGTPSCSSFDSMSPAVGSLSTDSAAEKLLPTVSKYGLVFSFPRLDALLRLCLDETVAL